MSATITTQHHRQHRVPALRTPTAQDYSKYDYYHGARPDAGLEGNRQTAPEVATTSGGRVQIGQ